MKKLYLFFILPINCLNLIKQNLINAPRVLNILGSQQIIKDLLANVHVPAFVRCTLDKYSGS